MERPADDPLAYVSRDAKLIKSAFLCEYIIMLCWTANAFLRIFLSDMNIGLSQYSGFWSHSSQSASVVAW